MLFFLFFALLCKKLYFVCEINLTIFMASDCYLCHMQILGIFSFYTVELIYKLKCLS
jgi:hypothetical protein